MALTYGNEKDFDTLTGKGLVLVDFFATWCGPCKMLGPVLESIAEDRSDVEIVKIDTDENEDLAQKFGVMSIPTLILMKDGKEVSKKVGLISKNDLVDWINEYR